MNMYDFINDTVSLFLMIAVCACVLTIISVRPFCFTLQIFY